MLPNLFVLRFERSRPSCLRICYVLHEESRSGPNYKDFTVTNSCCTGSDTPARCKERVTIVPEVILTPARCKERSVFATVLKLCVVPGVGRYSVVRIPTRYGIDVARIGRS